MAYKALKIAGVVHKNEQHLVKKLVKVANTLSDTANEYVVVTEATLIGKTLYVAGDRAKTSLGLADNVFTLDQLTANKADVETAIANAVNDTGVYSDTVNMGNVVTYDMIANFVTQDQLNSIVNEFSSLNNSLTTYLKNINSFYSTKADLDKISQSISTKLDALKTDIANANTNASALIAQVKAELLQEIANKENEVYNKIVEEIKAGRI